MPKTSLIKLIPVFLLGAVQKNTVNTVVFATRGKKLS